MRESEARSVDVGIEIRASGVGYRVYNTMILECGVRNATQHEKLRWSMRHRTLKTLKPQRMLRGDLKQGLKALGCF